MRTELGFEINISFIRHGLTKMNEERRYISTTDEGLSEAGREQIISLKNSGYYSLVEAVFVSGFCRTIETAEIIFNDKRPVQNSLIGELDFGEFEGKNYDELKDNKSYQAWLDSNGSLATPGGESRGDFEKRVLEGFEEILFQAKDLKNIAIVCHGGTVMALADLLTENGYYDIMLKAAERLDVSVSFEIKGNNDVSISSFCITSRHNI